MATHKNTIHIPFLLEKKDVVLVKPAKPTPSEVLSFSTIDNDPNLEIICQTIYAYKAKRFSSSDDNGHDLASSNGKTHDLDSCDPASVISDALSRVLVYYYPLAGKLKRHSDGELRLNCNAAGVPFLVATANCELSSLGYLDGITVELAKPFVFDWPGDGGDGRHPLVLQVTKFSCGGFTIGMGISHSVCDGFGAAQFFRALAELASGKSEPTVKPVWERERLVGTPRKTPFQIPIDEASLATSPHLPPTEIVHDCFNVNSESIKRLKTSLMKQCGDEAPKEGFTTIEALSAYVWRSRFRALELNSDGTTLFSMAVGYRRLLNPPLPDGYYGNAFGPANATTMGKDLNEGPLSRVSKLIKESKKIACSSDNIWNSIDMLESMRRQNIKFETNDATVVVTDWRRLGLVEEVDFGWKEPVNMIPVPWNMFDYVGLCIFTSPSSLDPAMKGGVRVLVSLPAAAIPKFREEMNALSLGDDKALA